MDGDFTIQQTSNLVERVYADAKAYDELHTGLVNGLGRVGFAFTKQSGRWHVMRKNGIRFSPEGGYHSFEDMLTAILEDIRHD